MLKVAAMAAVWLACRSQAVSATAVYAVTKVGSLYRSTDGAKSWQQVPIQGVPPATYASALAIDPQNPGNIYVALEAGATGKGSANGPPPVPLFRSVDGGQSWSQITLPAGAFPARLVVDPAAPNTLYSVTNSTLYRSTDSGSTFSAATLSLPVTGISFDPNRAGVVYASAAGASDSSRRNIALYKSTDSGNTWAPLGTLPWQGAILTAHNVAVDPRNSNILYVPVTGTCPAGVANCGLLRSTDGGNTWEIVNLAGSYYSVLFDSRNGNIYAAGMLPPNGRLPQTGHVARSTDGGKTWTSLDAGFSTNPVDVYLDPNVNSTMYAAPATGTVPTGAGGVYVSTNGGAAWTLSQVAPQSAPNDSILAVQVTSGAPAAPPPPPPGGSVTRTVSAASQQDGPVAAESIVVATGSLLATGSAMADYDQPSTTLAGTTVNVTDSAGVTRPAALFKVSPTQVTYQIPPGTAVGAAAVTITAGDGTAATAKVQVAAVAPGVYTLNSDGLVRAYALRLSNGNEFIEDVFEIDPSGAVIAHPITISNGDEVHLVAYGTGFRAAGGDVSATIRGTGATVLYAGPQGIQPGLDQFTLFLPPALATGGPQSVPIVLTAGGQTANTVYVTVQ